MAHEFLRAAFLALAIATAAAGCSSPAQDAASTATDADGGGSACDVSPTFSSIRSRVLASASCAVAGCHATPGQAGLSFDVSPDVVYQSLVGTPSHTSALKRVVPSAPDESFLFLKVSEDTPPTGTRMPSGAKPLSACETGAIRAWIAAGASKD